MADPRVIFALRRPPPFLVRRLRLCTMQDLLLWRLLRSGHSDAPTLLPLLRQLAAVPLQDRFPFFGLLPPLLQHADPELRAAALRVLHGAAGPLAFQQVIKSL